MAAYHAAAGAGAGVLLLLLLPLVLLTPPVLLLRSAGSKTSSPSAQASRSASESLWVWGCGGGCRSMLQPRGGRRGRARCMLQLSLLASSLHSTGGPTPPHPTSCQPSRHNTHKHITLLALIAPHHMHMPHMSLYNMHIPHMSLYKSAFIAAVQSSNTLKYRKYK